MTKFQPGDIVRSLARKPLYREIGDVFAVARVRAEGPYSVEQVHYEYVPGETTWGDAREFELIARAGEPVTYQPGDVVEVVEARYDLAKGQRVTLTEVRGPVVPKVWAGCYGSRKDGFQSADRLDGRVKLVHRPDPVKAEGGTGRQPLVYTYAGVGPIREGDELELTVRGQFRMVANEGCVELPAQEGDLGRLRSQFVNLAQAQTVTPVEKPLAVGDKVRSYRHNPEVGELMAMDEAYAAVRTSKGWYTTWLANLERVP